MAKLNPPILEGKIPACVIGDSNIVSADIPFVMNRSVGYDDIRGIIIKFRTVGGIQIGNPYEVTNIVNHEDIPSGQSYIDKDLNLIHIYNIPNSIKRKMNIGQYYKVQIAYLDTMTEVGYYSSVGIIKYTMQPSIKCEKKSEYELYFRGIYEPNKKESTEKLYSSHFVLRKGYTTSTGTSNEKFYPWPSDDTSIIEITPEKVHMDADLDYEDYEIKKELDWTYTIPRGQRAYKVSFIPTSINLYVGEASVNLHKQTLNPFPPSFVLNVENEYENAYTTISISGGTLPSEYTYVLWRYNKDEEWVKLNDIFISPFEDFTVEHGKQYTYAIQGVPKDGASNATEKLLAAPMTAQFEDMFLGDKDRQLRIQFNPKVSNYKRTVLESKVETIGGKYPIIFRNGNVDYREIGLGGLISYLMDKDNLFKVFTGSPTEAVRQDTASTRNDEPQSPTALSDKNRYKEKVFREAVLEWLTNGEPKYFRSPTEGNHIVRVMNVSLTPNDTLGRMIYTFTATSYEVADNTIENLAKYRLASWEE